MLRISIVAWHVGRETVKYGGMLLRNEA